MHVQPELWMCPLISSNDIAVKLIREQQRHADYCVPTVQFYVHQFSFKDSRSIILLQVIVSAEVGVMASSGCWYFYDGPAHLEALTDVLIIFILIFCLHRALQLLTEFVLPFSLVVARWNASRARQTRPNTTTGVYFNQYYGWYV
ncbi:hypothetical protein CTI12_AA084670 [Artemisia annua]|uniref:Uncharacterized protein n=1 Tax=Artemisia annua TaxID=35608 RepID=A0A2U1Q282_ARTAN|nr:hypothetical protein CTI12_AA084670 [Artemisia annua]